MLKDFTLSELQRRREAFMTMWQGPLPNMVAETGMTYAEMSDIG